MAGLSLQFADSVAILTVDQPGSKVNVFTRALIAEFGEVVNDLAMRKDLTGLVLQSAKPGIFIAGADLKEFAGVPSPDHGPTREYIEIGLRVLDALESLPFPTIACIDGVALGGGLELALACDFRLAGTNPKFKLGLPEVALGLIPGWGGTQRLPRIIGQAAAIDMIVHNRQLDAKTAHELGLVAKIVPSERLREDALQVLRDAQAGNSWQAVRERKRRAIAGITPCDLTTIGPGPQRLAALKAIEVIERGCQRPLDEGVQVETGAFMNLVASAEARQLIADFFASRKK